MTGAINIGKKQGHCGSLMFLLLFEERNIVTVPDTVIKTSEYLEMFM